MIASRIETIFVPWQGCSLNRIWAGVHYSRRRMLVGKAHAAVSRVVEAAGIQPFRGPVSLTFCPQHSSGQRRMDCTNYAASTKMIEDGLVQAGILPGDAFHQVVSVQILAPIRGEDKGIYVRISEQA